MYQTYDELQHYGILGMKWGRRRSDSQLAAAKGKSESTNKTSTSSKSNSQKKLRDVSDAELREAVNRLELEKRYRSLQSERNVVLNTAKKYTSDVATTVLKESIKQGATEAGKQVVKYAIGTAINSMFKKNIINVNTTNDNNKK